MPELTPKQRIFKAEYLKDMNGTKAAIRAGYSERNASRIAAELLGKTHIKEAIEAELAAREERTQINADWVLKRLADEAEADIADLYTETGAIKPIHEWPKIWRQGLVAGLETETLRAKGDKGTGQWRGQHQDVRDDDEEPVEETVVVKIKLSDRVRSLELIGKHVRVNAFQDVVEHKGLDGIADRLTRAAKRDT